MYQFTGQGQDLLAQARQFHTESNDFRAKRRLERAAQSLEMAFKLRKTALISPHAVLTATIDSLAHLYQEMGNHERWHHYAKMVVEEKVAMLGELHVETQSALDNLHDACVAMGDFEGAEEARKRNWHAKTSVYGIKDETVDKKNVVGDIERMLEYWRKVVPSIRRSSEAEADIETRLKISQGPISTQAQVDAAQHATNALMHCDFNDRRPIKRDPELAQLLVDRMTPADYLIQFDKPPETRWRKGSQIWTNEEGQPATPPNEIANNNGDSGGGGGGQNKVEDANTNQEQQQAPVEEQVEGDGEEDEVAPPVE